MSIAHSQLPRALFPCGQRRPYHSPCSIGDISLPKHVYCTRSLASCRRYWRSVLGRDRNLFPVGDVNVTVFLFMMLDIDIEVVGRAAVLANKDMLHHTVSVFALPRPGISTLISYLASIYGRDAGSWWSADKRDQLTKAEMSIPYHPTAIQSFHFAAASATRRLPKSKVGKRLVRAA